jgi:hypothetical protein
VKGGHPLKQKADSASQKEANQTIRSHGKNCSLAVKALGWPTSSISLELGPMLIRSIALSLLISLSLDKRATGNLAQIQVDLCASDPNRLYATIATTKQGGVSSFDRRPQS